MSLKVGEQSSKPCPPLGLGSHHLCFNLLYLSLSQSPRTNRLTGVLSI